MVSLMHETRTAGTPEGEPVTLVELTGSLEPATLGEFDALTRGLPAEAPGGRVVLDLAGVKYINSTAIGKLVRLHDALEERQGRLVLARLQPKVRLILEMLGLQAVFRFAGDEAEALRIAGGAEPEALPGAAPGGRAAPGAGGERVIACAACGTELLEPAPGYHRCPRCRSILRMRGTGRLEALTDDGSQAVELVLPPEMCYYGEAGRLAGQVARRSGAADARADALDAAVRGVLGALARHALAEAPPSARLHLLVRGAEGRVAARIYAGGRSLPGPDLLDGCGAHVDRLDVRALPEGTVITLELTGD
jgi:anti-sigma B factor antagonist